jgi:glucose 1-dehydrogenase
MRFVGKRALVTGGANGIGAATCRRLVDEGAYVLVADVDDEGARRLVAELGSAARAVHLDVADAASWDALGTAEADGVDVVVNNAFTVTVQPAGELAPGDWDRQLAVDLSSVYHSVRTFLPSLIDRHGAVVNVASVHAVVGYRGHPAYAAAKGGVTALTRQLSADYGAQVRFNAVLPGAIDTRVWDGADAAERAHHAGLAAMNRFGRPAEVAAAIAFLASDDASYVCGACLTVDGGLTTARY